MASPGFFDNLPFCPYTFFYNVKIVPSNSLNSINLYFDSCKVDTYFFTPTVTVYDVYAEKESTYIYISFNSENKADINFANKNKMMSLFFINGENDNIYMGVISANDSKVDFRSIFNHSLNSSL